MENNANGVPPAESNPAHTMAEVHAVVFLRPLHWAVMDCKGHSIDLPKWDDLSTACIRGRCSVRTNSRL